jgi:hypothetical protein
MALTPEELREHVTVDVPDSALQRYIDDAESEIDYQYGDVSSATETFDIEAPSNVLYPSRRVQSVTKVTERYKLLSWNTVEEEVLSANDYRLVNEIRLDRLQTGDNPRNSWGDQVVVEYTPKDKSKQRDGVVIDLVKLTLAFEGVDKHSLGDYSATQGEYEQKRRDILSRLAMGDRWWA